MDMKILVIDEREDVRKNFALAVAGTRYTLDAAGTALRGIGMAARGHYDMVFLGATDAATAGVETLRKLRGIVRDIPICVFSVSPAALSEQLQAARNEGLVFDAVRKPDTVGEIRDLVRGILARPDEAPSQAEETGFSFKLFLAGRHPLAGSTERRVRLILDGALPDGYLLQTIDVLQDPGGAEDEHVFATPTLIRISPEPTRRVMGDLSDRERVLAHLGITP